MGRESGVHDVDEKWFGNDKTIKRGSKVLVYACTHTHTHTHSETCKQTHTAYALWLQATVVPYVSLFLTSSASPLNMSPFQFSSILPSLRRTAPSSSSWSASQGSCSNSALFLQPTLLRSNPSLLWVRVRPLAPLLTDPLISLDLFFSPLISSFLLLLQYVDLLCLLCVALFYTVDLSLSLLSSLRLLSSPHLWSSVDFPTHSHGSS